jgi:hypothetical protein
MEMLRIRKDYGMNWRLGKLNILRKLISNKTDDRNQKDMEDGKFQERH